MIDRTSEVGQTAPLIRAALCRTAHDWRHGENVNRRAMAYQRAVGLAMALRIMTDSCAAALYPGIYGRKFLRGGSIRAAVELIGEDARKLLGLDKVDTLDEDPA